MKKAVFLDRDGVINKRAPDGGYITSLEDFQILPGVPQAISLLNQASYLVIVVTNQRCIAKGLLSVAALNRIHQKMSDELAAAGARLDGVYFCPHEKEPPCQCRKPAPGMLLTAAAELNIDLQNSWMIGDTDSDIEAGRQASCRTVHLVSSPAQPKGKADLSAESLIAAVQKILSQTKT